MTSFVHLSYFISLFDVSVIRTDSTDEKEHNRLGNIFAESLFQETMQALEITLYLALNGQSEAKQKIPSRICVRNHLEED